MILNYAYSQTKSKLIDCCQWWPSIGSKFGSDLYHHQSSWYQDLHLLLGMLYGMHCQNANFLYNIRRRPGQQAMKGGSPSKCIWYSDSLPKLFFLYIKRVMICECYFLAPPCSLLRAPVFYESWGLMKYTRVM